MTCLLPALREAIKVHSDCFSVAGRELAPGHLLAITEWSPSAENYIRCSVSGMAVLLLVCAIFWCWEGSCVVLTEPQGRGNQHGVGGERQVRAAPPTASWRAMPAQPPAAAPSLLSRGHLPGQPPSCAKQRPSEMQLFETEAPK